MFETLGSVLEMRHSEPKEVAFFFMILKMVKRGGRKYTGTNFIVL